MPAANPQWYDSTDTTLQSGQISYANDAGTTIGPNVYHLWNSKGNALVDSITEAVLRVEAKVDGVWVTEGVPALDEGWVRAKVDGMTNTGDSTMVAQTTGYVPLGTYHPLIVRDIPGNCARHISVKVELPSSSTEMTHDLQLVLIYDAGAIALPIRVGLSTGSGVLDDVLDPSLRRIVRGFGITASGATTVAVAKGSLVYDGARVTRIGQTVTLNQTAADGALASGQSYKARLSLTSAGAVTTTKSAKAASPSTPDVPPGEISIGVITVTYQAGGTSVINSGNVDVSGTVRGEYLVEAGTGLSVKIGGGTAIHSTDTEAASDYPTTQALTDNATNHVWLRPDGSFTANTTGTSPETGAQKLAIVVTSGGAITSITDARRMVGRAVDEYTITLTKTGTFNATFADQGFGLLPFDADLVSIDIDLAKTGTWASGSFKFDVLSRAAGVQTSTAGTTVFTSSGTEDNRPTIAHNATSARATNVDHEVIAFTKGARFSFSCVAVPSTVSVDADTAICTLHFRRK